MSKTAPPAPPDSPVLAEKLMDAQTQVLGSLLLDQSLVGPVLSQVSDQDFTDAKLRAIYQRPCDGHPDVDVHQGPHLLPGCCWRRCAAKGWTELPAGHPGRVGSHKFLLGRDP